MKLCLKCNHFKLFSEFHKDSSRKDGMAYYCKFCTKNYQQLNKNIFKKANTKYRINNLDKVNLRSKIKRKQNLNFKLSTNLRNRLNDALKNNFKSGSALNLLGCSIQELKIHLEKQFKPGMNWSNHSLKGWHIDHIKPCAKFDLSNPKEQAKCFHYSNLQPLWAKDNISKNCR